MVLVYLAVSAKVEKSGRRWEFAFPKGIVQVSCFRVIDIFKENFVDENNFPFSPLSQHQIAPKTKFT